MEKILILGASGALGEYILKECYSRNFKIRVLTHSKEGHQKVRSYTDDIWCANAQEDLTKIKGITKGVDYVISALGKSVSLFSPGPNSFFEIDYKANVNILQEAKENGVKRFFYISMKGAEEASEYTIPGIHKLMEDELKESGINYSIVRPVGFYSGLNDLVIMAKRKVIPLIGDGEAKTNSIFHGDLANYIMTEFLNLPELKEVGGPQIHTRMEMAKMIQKKIGGEIIKIPKSIAKHGSKLPKLLQLDEISDKLAYFRYIMSKDMIAEEHGKMSFETYLDQIDTEDIK